MLTLNDPLELDILTVLLNALQTRLQRKEMRDQLFPKYEGKPYGKDTFDVVLQRKLDRLCSLGILRKEYVARSAFYFIMEEMRDEVKLLVEKQEIKKKIDQMTPQKIQEFLKFFAFLVESKEGEEFWVWLPDMDHPEKIKKFKYVETKILRQD